MEARFAVLEQYLPDGEDHPFAVTMLNHFRKLNSPLKTAIRYPSAEDQKRRFARGNWTHIDFRSLWSLWSDDTFIAPQSRRALDEVEPFDEWEEFALFCSHYFLLVARNSGPGSAESASQELDVQTRVKSTKDASDSTLMCKSYPLESQPRRFAASLMSDSSIWSTGGHGIQSRLDDADLLHPTGGLALSYQPNALSMPRLPNQLLCHTITSLDDEEALIVGGRASPASASSTCYLKKGHSWLPAPQLPFGLFRHCAVRVMISVHQTADTETGVLVFGGKTGPSDINGGWLLWTKRQGWQVLKIVGMAPQARFGATMVTTDSSKDAQAEQPSSTVCSGLVTGGIGAGGTVLQDMWQWSLHSDSQGQPFLAFANQTNLLPQGLVESTQFGRFGASLVKVNQASRQQYILIGGVSGQHVLSEEMEVLSFELISPLKWAVRSLQFDWQRRPLLVGCNVEVSNHDAIVIAFGGAVCFSFGTCWNEAIWTLTLNGQITSPWGVVPQTQCSIPDSANAMRPDLSTHLERSQADVATERSGDSIDAASAPVDFTSILHRNTPVVLRGFNLGPCTQRWTSEYLKDQVGAERQVVIHSSPTPTMNFLIKDFTYTTISFGDLLSRASSGEHLYLRALSASSPTSQPTKLSDDFPSIANDFQLPAELAYVTGSMHSSPLRLSGPVTMWLHFDVMANVYCQIRGQKRLVLFPPSDVNCLDFPAGASSSRLNIFDADGQAHYPDGTHPIVFDVKPGHVLFIPPLWPHTTKPIVAEDGPDGALSVAVNVFFKSLQAGYAAGKDVYGNRDLAAYENGRRDVARVAKAFQGLPDDARRFYLARLAKELADLAAA